jgi:hypothetical protein
MNQMDAKEQLQRQMRLIDGACRNYDAGLHEAALHVAVAIRVLIHETAQSHSLISQLSLRNSAKLLSTFPEIKLEENLPGNVLTATIMFGGPLGPNGVKPELGSSPNKHYLSVDEWWNEVVHEFRQRYSRKDIILSAANQDGGAHADPNPNQKTEGLRESVGTLTTITPQGTRRLELTNSHFHLIRQFGFEILNSTDLCAAAN